MINRTPQTIPGVNNAVMERYQWLTAAVIRLLDRGRVAIVINLMKEDLIDAVQIAKGVGCPVFIASDITRSSVSGVKVHIGDEGHDRQPQINAQIADSLDDPLHFQLLNSGFELTSDIEVSAFGHQFFERENASQTRVPDTQAEAGKNRQLVFIPKHQKMNFQLYCRAFAMLDLSLQSNFDGLSDEEKTEQRLPIRLSSPQANSFVKSQLLDSDTTPLHEALLANLERVANRFRELGLYEDLLRCLKFIKSQSRNSVEDNARFWYWWVFACISIDVKHPSLQLVPFKMKNDERQIRNLLLVSKAPLLDYELRNPLPLTDDESLDSRRRSGTLHVLRGEYEIGFDALRFAFFAANQHGDVWQMSKIASSYANCLSMKGEYWAASNWAEHALSLLKSSDGNGLVEVDPLLEHEVEAQCLHLLLLTTNESESYGPRLRDMVEKRSPLDLVGAPKMDFVAGTLGDKFFVQSRFRDALSFYESVLGSAHSEAVPLFSIDVVKVKLRLGDRSGALKIIERVEGIASTTGTVARLYAGLCRGFFFVDELTDDSQHYLMGLMESANASRLLNIVNEVAVLLVRFAFESGNLSVLQRVFELSSEPLSELSGQGWGLLSGRPEMGNELKDFWRDSLPNTKISIFGNYRLHRGEEPASTFTLRTAEALACLLIKADGMSAERLAVAMYGDKANLGTIKSVVSRLRSSVAVSSNPYRLNCRMDSDYRRVRVALERGLLREALDLYDGPLLPESVAPMIVEEREAIDSALREGVLGRGDPDLLYEYAQKVPEDLEVWLVLLDALEESDPRRAMAAARVETLEGELAAG